MEVQMIKIRNSYEIGKFIKSKLEDLKIKPIELAEKLADLKGTDEKGNNLYNKNQLRDLVYKWINGKRTPGIDYVYFLAKILKVSIEELLVAGEVCEKYDVRPYTLYGVAKSNNFEMLDEIMATSTPDGSIVGENYDEYDKTILDYVIEFEQNEMLKYMIDKKYIQFVCWGDYLTTPIRHGNINSYQETTQKILKLAVKYDDVELLSKIIKREVPVWRRQKIDNKEDIYRNNNYSNGYILDEELLLKILETEKIYNYLTEEYCLNVEDWKILNSAYYHDKNGNLINDYLTEVERLPFMFNLLIDVAIKNNKTKQLNEMINLGKKFNKKVLEKLFKVYNENEIDIDEFGNCKNGRFGSLSMIAIIPDLTKNTKGKV